MKLGVQVFSVRDEAAADLAGVAKQIKEMGYDGVELAGLYGNTIPAVGEIFRNAGLEIVSAHMSGEEVGSEETLRAYREAGLTYAGVQGMPLKPEAGWAHGYLREVGERCHKVGLQLVYHNHSYEFETYEGELKIDIMYAGVDPDLLQIELDTCWCNAAGVDPVAYLRKYAGRVPLIHLKDYTGEPHTDSFALASVGSGLLPTRAILDTAREIGTKWVIVEQDNPTPGKKPLECIAESAAYLRSVGV